MAKEPTGHKRSGDAKNPAAVEMGKLGGRRRAELMTPERRAEIARKAAEIRWKK